ncbi:acyl-CoA thioesterase [Solihabitans fulvus]|uniref:Acyl-CoA thioesterase n=1 Tax=Solihabitans fulvus TaxID=1892852 RepID=A0A5B2XQK9_9PSEU|nr:thioesterase family protein [Solihabitans fulvus]KAA2265240.1 acyl-CoA thioesterase [Solihabitans fulvus]
MGVFVAEVRPRWSDMDVFGHVNHAQTVTLLEEARVALLFSEAARHGVTDLAKGVVVVKLTVDFRAPLLHTGEDVRVELSVQELRYASFTLAHTIRAGKRADSPVAVQAEVLLAAYGIASSSPRRLTDAERDFLAGWRAGGTGA